MKFGIVASIRRYQKQIGSLFVRYDVITMDDLEGWVSVKMNKKIVSIIFYIIAVVSLVIGASFHGYRMHPEDVAKYNIGVTMGIVMISIFAISLIVAVILTILARKEGKS